MVKTAMNRLRSTGDIANKPSNLSVGSMLCPRAHKSASGSIRNELIPIDFADTRRRHSTPSSIDNSNHEVDSRCSQADDRGDEG